MSTPSEDAARPVEPARSVEPETPNAPNAPPPSPRPAPPDGADVGRAARAARMHSVGRVLAFAGAALFALAAWLPWVVVTAGPDGGARRRLLLDPGRIGAPPLPLFYDLPAAFVVWSTLSVLGVLLAALLWLGERPWSAWLTWLIYTTWLLLTSYTAARSALALLRPGDYRLTLVPGVGDLGAGPIIVHGYDPGAGLAIALVALLLCWAGGTLLILGGARALAAGSVEPAPSGLRRPPSVWALTLGLVGWALGFLWMPWAVVDCGAPPLFGGTCTGLGATGALRYALGASVTLPAPWSAGGLVLGFDPLAALYALPTLLLGGALLLAIGLWRRPAAGALSGWLAAWLFAATVCALLARYGVQLVLAGAPALGLRPGAWEGAPGVYVTLLSLVVVLAGLGVRWLAPLIRGAWTARHAT